jgi:uncharacterized protein
VAGRARSGHYAPHEGRPTESRRGGQCRSCPKSTDQLDALPDLLTEDLVWHFYGGVEGIATDHHGLDNIYANLWGKLFEVTGGTFAVEPVSISAAGDELVMAQVRVTIGVDVRPIDAVAVYRVSSGRITEAFDIPSRS